jgi:hypothetical protein
MLSEQELEDNLRDLIIEICAVMQSRGFGAVSVGAIMRLIGVNPASATKHDNDIIDLGEDFDRVIQRRITAQQVPPGTTLH